MPAERKVMKITTISSVLIIAILIAGAGVVATYAHNSSQSGTYSSNTCSNTFPTKSHTTFTFSLSWTSPFTFSWTSDPSSSSSSSSSTSSSSSSSSSSSGSTSSTSSTTSSTSSTCSVANGYQNGCNGLTVGETLTLSGLTGYYQTWGVKGSKGQTASATLDLKVADAYATGCILTITGGTLTLGSTSISIMSGGSIVLNKPGLSGDGWGETSTGSFLIQTFQSNGFWRHSSQFTINAVNLDVENSGSEFLVYLHS